MDDLQTLMMLQKLRQQQQPERGMPELTAGQAKPFGPPAFGSQVKDYVGLAAGGLTPMGMAAGMGRGLTMPAVGALGNMAARSQMPDLSKILGAPSGVGGSMMRGSMGDIGQGTAQKMPPYGSPLTDLIAAIMRRRGQGMAFPPQTSGSQFGINQGVLTQ